MATGSRTRRAAVIPDGAGIIPGEVIPAPRNDAGKFAAEYPTDGRELVALWDLPGDAFTSQSVKLARCIPGSQQTELLRTMPISNYNMEDLAGEFGPGRYQLKPGPGLYSHKLCTLNISTEFARSNGWQDMPPAPIQRQQGASDMWMREQMARSTQGPMNPVDMATLIELAVSKAVAQRAPVQENPVAPIMSGFELAMQMMEKARSFVNPVQEVIKEPASIGDALIGSLPSILDTLRMGITAFAANTAPKPEPAPAPAHHSVKVIAAPASMPEPEPKIEETMPEHHFPQLDQPTIDAITPIVSVLKEFAPKLVSFLVMPVPASTLGSQLSGMIGPDLEASTVALAEVVAVHGPGILGEIHPEMATEKAAAVVAACAEYFKQENE